MEKWKLLSGRILWAVGRKVQRDPEHKRITQAEVGKVAGVSPSAAGYWFSDTNGIDAEKARKVAAFLDVDPVWLESGEGDPDEGLTGSAPTDESFAMIPQLDLQAACGPNVKYQDHVLVKGGLAFKRTFLQEIGVPEGGARVIHAAGTSMEPTIGHGRVVLINTSDSEPQDGRVFLIIDEDGGLVLKRLVREYEPSLGTSAWKIRSDNPDKRRYPDKFWPEDARARIVGRAVWHDGLL